MARKGPAHMATIYQVWGDLPRSLKQSMTDRQKKALNRYVQDRIIRPCYRLAYDLGREAGIKQAVRRIPYR